MAELKQIQEEDPIELVKSTMAKSGVLIDKAVTQAETTVDRTSELTKKISSSLDQQTGNLQTIKEAELTGQLARENANTAVLEAAGGVEGQVVLMEELAKQEGFIDQLQNDRVEIFSTDITGIAPIDLFINSIRGMKNQVQLSAARVERDQTLNQIRNITGAQETFAQVNAQTQRTINEASIQANLAQIGVTNTIKASEQEILNTHTNARAMNDLVNMTDRQVSQRMEVVKFGITEQQFKIQQEELVFRREQLAQQREEFKIRLPKLQQDLERGAIDLDQAKTIQSALNEQVTYAKLGQSVVHGRYDSDEVIKTALIRGGPEAAKYAEFINIGLTENGVIGGTPAESKRALNVVDPNSTAPRTKGIRLLDNIGVMLNQEIAELQKNPAYQPPKTAEALDAAYNDKAERVMADFAANITGSDNPYSAPPMGTMEILMRNKGNLLFDEFIKPLGMQEFDPQRIMDTTIAAIKTKKITPEQATANMVQMFEVIALANNLDFGGLERVGLPKQVSYNTTIRVPKMLEAKPFTDIGLRDVTSIISQDLFGAPTKIVNMMDYTQVEQAIIANMKFTKSPAPSTATNVPNNPPPKLIAGE